MAEENQVMKEPQGEAQQIMKEPQGKAAQVQQVTIKNLKKVEAGKRLAESNCKKREVKKQAKLEASGTVIALGVIDGLGYYIHQSKKGEQPQRNNPKPHPQPQTNKFEMD